MSELKEQVLILSLPKERERLEKFLNAQHLAMDSRLEYAVVIMENNKIVASGGFDDRILKCIAVDKQHRNAGLSATVITRLLDELCKRGRSHHFVFTKPENRAIFSRFGFFPVSKTDKVILMENRRDGIKGFIKAVVAESGKIVPSAAIVVNCNPFTLGHQYLIEHAAARCEKLHLFVVWEDQSSFPSQTRYHLVKKGTAHLPNVVVHKGKDYIISNATFPSYFLKADDDRVKIQARLDLTVFCEYIAKPLKIKKRFVGQEPYCPVTSTYNHIMKDMLPDHDITVEVVPRLRRGARAISASMVREFVRSNDIEKTRELVPETTYHFLLSKEAQDIIKKIQTSDQRH